ncbi:MAG TPA: glycosyltransferase family 4 protein [Thermoanaerobaculia bacterium]|nr:glycosyltransferase family 4 protein [Thermoanaerobaculia bacterium]
MKKRILFVVNHAGFFLSHRLPIAEAAIAAGYDVHVATPKSKHVPQIIAAGLTWHPIRLARSAMNPVREIQTFGDLLRLYKMLAPALVHHVTSKPVLYGTVAARITGVPAVVNAISGTGHAFVEAGVGRRIGRAFLGLAYRISQRHPHMRAIFQNREQLSEFTARGWVRAGDASLIPGSGVDLDRFKPAMRQRSVPVVTLASRMLISKGVCEFVDAARMLRSRNVAARFRLVGEPDPDNPGSLSEGRLRMLAADGVVEYCGRSEDMPSVFAETDVFCLPTYYGEGVPKVLVEAAACGLPCVTTDWPGCRDVVVNGETGILVPARNAQQVAEALERLIADPDLRRRMGALAAVRASQFSLSMVVTRTLALYRELLQ